MAILAEQNILHHKPPEVLKFQVLGFWSAGGILTEMAKPSNPVVAVTRSRKINLVFTNATEPLKAGQISLLHSVFGSSNFSGNIGCQTVEPLCVLAGACSIFSVNACGGCQDSAHDCVW